MKPDVLAGLALLALAACASTHAPTSTPFHVVEEFAAPGDEIALDSVTSDTGTLVPGATIRVRGRYRVASIERGTLFFGISNGACTGATLREVVRGAGEFDFTMHVKEPGYLHVSLYSPEKHDPGNNCIGKCRFDLDAR